MMGIEDGGAAFPVLKVHQPWNRDIGEFGGYDGVCTEIVSPGMSLRDYFAAKVMHALIAKREPQAWSRDNLSHMAQADQIINEVTTSAYQWADAMLRARAAKSPKETQDAHLREFGR